MESAPFDVRAQADPVRQMRSRAPELSQSDVRQVNDVVMPIEAGLIPGDPRTEAIAFASLLMRMLDDVT
jgi:hypothetical protein